MLIGHSGRVWEPENELLTDNSLLCTLHQRKEIWGGGQVRVKELPDASLTLVYKKSGRCCSIGQTIVYSWK